MSSRHLSFVETGRSRPSRELVLHLAEALEVPLRDRNALLLAAGYSPVFRQTPIEAPEMEPVRNALDLVLSAHAPYPALVIDRMWNLVTGNTALGIFIEGVRPELLAPPINVLRVSLHPDGFARRVVNFEEYSSHLLARLRRQADLSGDPEMAALYEELAGYPGVSLDLATAEARVAATDVVLPVRVRSDDGELSFFSTIATFGTPIDITLDDLAIESFFPADEPTAAVLRRRAG